jgi:hypothetical protein
MLKRRINVRLDKQQENDKGKTKTKRRQKSNETRPDKLETETETEAKKKTGEEKTIQGITTYYKTNTRQKNKGNTETKQGHDENKDNTQG